MHLFYAPSVSENIFELDESESLHAVKVLRLKQGDEITLLDGKGGKYEAKISDARPKKCSFEILSKEKINPRPFHLHIAIAPTKSNERYEWFLEKATELGVEEITPVICERSERKAINHDRYEKILISAIKQSMNVFLPRLNVQTDFKSLIKSLQPGFLAYCGEHNSGLLWKKKMAQSANVLIGPEGDFSGEEVSLAIQAGWIPVSLGETRLRTETAGVFVSSVMRTLL
jgi:16S rRNA (uracil1498-N3)-methyltransferase